MFVTSKIELIKLFTSIKHFYSVNSAAAAAKNHSHYLLTSLIIIFKLFIITKLVMIVFVHPIDELMDHFQLKQLITNRKQSLNVTQ